MRDAGDSRDLERTAGETRSRDEADAPERERDEALLADGREHGLDPRTVTLERLGGAVFAIVVTGAGFVALVALAFRLRPGTLGLWALIGAWGAAGATLAAVVWFWPPVRYRHRAWLLDPHGLTIRRGVVFRAVISIPRSRVQHTDVSQGPIERALELATLVIHTAGTQHAAVSLGGLRHGVALRLRDHLIDVDDRDAV